MPAPRLHRRDRALGQKWCAAVSATALVWLLGCSGGAETPERGRDAVPAGEPLFVPEDLSNTELDGEGGLRLVAFTLEARATGLSLFAAVKNEGDTPACDPGMMTHFIDRSEQLVASAGARLYGGRLYRVGSEPNVVVSCVDPGQLAMAASTDLPESLVLEELGYLQHTFPAFTVDHLAAVEGDVTVGDVETISNDAGSVYTGTLRNGLDTPVSQPRVVIFPLSRAGRPLDMATSSASVTIPPGGVWPFETISVAEHGVAHAAFPAVTIPP
jgi:hypothetical protein